MTPGVLMPDQTFLIADDHWLVRQGLRQTLSARNRVEAVQEAMRLGLIEPPRASSLGDVTPGN